MAEQQPKQQQQQNNLQGVDIAKVLREQGPIVKCVVLRVNKKDKDNSNDDEDGHKKPSAITSNDDNAKMINLNLEELTDEIELDMTPKKNKVEEILGGAFTFVGQYEEEGIMLMARRGWVHLETDKEDEEEEDNDIPKEWLNPHKLQPPFDKAQVYGDILVIKVSEMPEEEDDETGEQKPAPMVPNDEFFQNYTKEEYLKFSARTDVVAPVLPDVPEDEVEEEVEDDDEEEENDEECEGEDDSEDEEEEDEEAQQAFMMQLLMTNVMKQFREKNGRGPSSEEVLVLRMAVAQKLGITLPSADDGEEGAEDNDDDKEENKPEENPKGKQDDTVKSTKNDESPGAKRENDSEGDANNEEPQKKRVKFGEDDDQKQTKAVLVQ